MLNFSLSLLDLSISMLLTEFNALQRATAMDNATL